MTTETTGGEDLKLLKLAIEALTKDDKSIEGIQALQKAIEINPRLAKAHQLLAMYYMGVQNGELAKKHFEILRSLDKELAQQLLDTPFGSFFERGVSFINL
jgi:Tfp pilus assembly protein PilF